MTKSFLGCLLILISLASTSSCSNDEVKTYSIINLIATPHRIDGQFIRTYGYVRVEEENIAIYLSESSAKYGIYSEAVWLSLDYSSGKTLSDWRHLDHKWIAIEGRFNSARKGHFELYAGTIENIELIQIREQS